MATITVNVNDDVAREFRKYAYEAYGQRKGTLGKALSEAMRMWSQRHIHLDAAMKLLSEGVDLGKLRHRHRRDLYDRD